MAACAASEEEAGTTTSLPERTELFAAGVTPLGRELWLHGGLAAEAGTAPPVTSVVPPGWAPNRRIV